MIIYTKSETPILLFYKEKAGQHRRTGPSNVPLPESLGNELLHHPRLLLQERVDPGARGVLSLAGDQLNSSRVGAEEDKQPWRHLIPLLDPDTARESAMGFLL